MKKYWFPFLILILNIAFSIWLWLKNQGNQQGQIMAVAGLQVLTMCILAIWFVIGSPFSKKLRISVAVTGLVALVIASQAFEIVGVTGNLIPIIELKYDRGRNQAELADIEVVRTHIDFPQFLGPNRDGIVPPFHYFKDWDTNPPKELWRIPIGEGWAPFSVSGNKAITLEQVGQQEQLSCYELFSGKLLWKSQISSAFEKTIGGNGPRSAPSIYQQYVFSLGANGILRANDLETGKAIWQVDMLNEFAGSNLEWGISCSPLVYENLVIAMAGGSGQSIVALDIETGQTIWKSGPYKKSYSSPILRKIHDQWQVVVLMGDGVAAFDPLSGQVLWQTDWSGEQPNVAVPIVNQSQVMVSSGYGIGSALFQIEQSQNGYGVQEIWRSPRLKAKFTNPVHLDGYVYGLDDGVLTCISWQDGSRQWKKGRYGHGQTLLVGNELWVMTEKGELVLGKADPNEWEELTSLKFLSGKVWNPPCIAAPYVLLRNNREAVCYFFDTPIENQLMEDGLSPSD